jgi:hypothetical protein
MYPEYEDQPAINAELVRRFSHLSAANVGDPKAEHLERVSA